MTLNPIYLDYNATTPVDKAVLEEMKPFLDSVYGNPSSIHEFGIKAKRAVENARKQVAALLNCFPDEIIFTSGGTESNNYAIKGAAYAKSGKGNHIITSAVEHPSVLEVCRYLEAKGFRVTYLPVDEYGMVDHSEVEKNIESETILITIMHANNETGTIQPVHDIGKIAKQHGVLFHTDAAQSCGKIPVDVTELGVDMLSLAGHKLYAPKGVGVLFVRRGVILEKLIHGADHEGNRRAGTENVIEIVGLGKAAEIASISPTLNPADRIPLQIELRDRLYEGIKEQIPRLKLNGHPTSRLPNTLNISFPGIEANRLLDAMKGIAASAGAACHSDRTDVSAVLTAMHIPIEFAMGTIRFSVGRMTTDKEIDEAIEIITNAVLSLSGDGQASGFRLQAAGEVKLTHFTHGLGCACKIRPQLLQSILGKIPVSADPDILVDQRNSDDAAVYKINDMTAIVQTVDVISPIVDDPYSFGVIAAANALSDIYAMGARPLFALSIIGFPDKLLSIEVLHRIISGATDKVGQAGIAIIGGHTIEDNEPKFGLVVTGVIHPGKIITNSGAQPGDAVILTKPIGTGIVSTALKRGMVDPETAKEIIFSMSELNDKAASVMLEFPVNACTDVTGFGLLGHLKEMITGSKTGAEIKLDDVPIFPVAWELATANIIPGGSKNNLDFISDSIEWDNDIPETAKIILSDAQTSGGLLITLPFNKSQSFVKELQASGVKNATLIGRITKEINMIRVKRK
jgi:cysteine desulfurase